MLEPALTAGFVTMGMDVVLVGPLPTPAIAMLTRSLRADIGVVLSASHNPYGDNGIKLFGRDGYKLSDEIELKIEACLAKGPSRRAVPAELGRVKRLDDAGGRYIEFVKQSFPRGLRLDGLRIVVDCAHGAGLQGGADGVLGIGRRGLRARRVARRAQHQPRMRRADARADAARGAGAPRRYRDRARRRRRPADRRRRARRHSRRRPADGADRDRAGAQRPARRAARWSRR